MGANSTQAGGVLLFLVAFTLLAGAFAGGGFVCVIGALVMLGVSCFLFAKCKPWENQE